MSRIELETRIDAPPERCFDLSRSVELHLEAAATTEERAVEGVTSGLLAAGDTVTWEARHLGRKRRLTVRISAYDRPRFFRDEQVRGPFRHFVHDHLFEPTDGGTRMRDVLELASGFPLVDRLVLAPHLRRFLLWRNELIKRTAERPRLRDMGFRTFFGRRIGIQTERLTMKAGADGLVHEECWFCGNDVQFRPDERSGSDAAVVIVEPLGGGEPTHGVCHVGCAERAHKSLVS